MKQKNRVLWIEDEAGHNLVQLTAPVIMNGNYDLVVVESASDGIVQLLRNKFVAIIVDIRIPPGDDKAWIKLFEKSGKEKISSRLGRHLLYTILGHPDAEIKLGEGRPKWIRPALIGVLTVESLPELDNDLKNLGISICHQKRAETSETILLDLIETVIKQANQEKGESL